MSDHSKAAVLLELVFIRQGRFGFASEDFSDNTVDLVSYINFVATA